MRIVTVDPGLDGVGVSLWDGLKCLHASGKAFPPRRGITTASPVFDDHFGNKIDRRVHDVTTWTYEKIAHFTFWPGLEQGQPALHLVVVEVPPPYHFQRERNRDVDQVKLIVGALYDRLRMNGFFVTGIYPTQWKPCFRAGRRRVPESAEATVARAKLLITTRTLVIDRFENEGNVPDVYTAVAMGHYITALVNLRERTKT